MHSCVVRAGRSGTERTSRIVTVRPFAVTPASEVALPDAILRAPTTSSNRYARPDCSAGVRIRSRECFTSAAVTGCPVEKRADRLTRNVYVDPPCEMCGFEAARSGIRRNPSGSGLLGYHMSVPHAGPNTPKFPTMAGSADAGVSGSATRNVPPSLIARGVPAAGRRNTPTSATAPRMPARARGSRTARRSYFAPRGLATRRDAPMRSRSCGQSRRVRGRRRPAAP